MEQIINYVLGLLKFVPDSLEAVKQLIQQQFGTAGVIAATIFVVSLIALLLSKVLKAGFNIVRYVVLPSVVVTFIATYFLPYSFAYILPVTVSFFSVVLMIKG